MIYFCNLQKKYDGFLRAAQLLIFAESFDTVIDKGLQLLKSNIPTHMVPIVSRSVTCSKGWYVQQLPTCILIIIQKKCCK